MRGKGKERSAFRTKLGITPAYAGKSSFPIYASSFLEDHPRLCGEKYSSIICMKLMTGSPPPMRGKVKATPPHIHEPRITPAYAGKSYLGRGVLRVRRDHPRLCGEKQCRNGASGGQLGSPPPMRGKDCRPSDAIVACGITPAYAGKSGIAARRSFWRQDHPRLCGEKYV